MWHVAKPSLYHQWTVSTPCCACHTDASGVLELSVCLLLQFSKHQKGCSSVLTCNLPNQPYMELMDYSVPIHLVCEERKAILLINMESCTLARYANNRYGNCLSFPVCSFHSTCYHVDQWRIEFLHKSICLWMIARSVYFGYIQQMTHFLYKIGEKIGTTIRK